MKRIVILVGILSQLILTNQSKADKVEVGESTITFFDSPCRAREFGVSFAVAGIKPPPARGPQVELLWATLDSEPEPKKEDEPEFHPAWFEEMKRARYWVTYREVKVGEKLHLVTGDFELTSATPADNKDVSRVTLKRLSITLPGSRMRNPEITRFASSFRPMEAATCMALASLSNDRRAKSTSL